jgi:hypothetical protein
MTEKTQATRDEDLWVTERVRSYYGRADSIALWLLATLVAVNTSGAGAALAMKVNEEAAIPFASGVFMAILSGMSSWGEAYLRAYAYRVREMKEEYPSRWFWARVLFRTAFALNLLSLAAFAVGCIIATGAI